MSQVRRPLPPARVTDVAGDVTGGYEPVFIIGGLLLSCACFVMLLDYTVCRKCVARSPQRASLT